MDIVIKTIPHAEQRYQTCGDWFLDENGDLQIRVSELPQIFNFGMEHIGNRRRMELCVAVHELIEALLCIDRGISDEEVTAFDKAFATTVRGAEGDEPGDDPAAPYREEHFFATTIERLLASELRVDWHDYEDAIVELDDGQA